MGSNKSNTNKPLPCKWVNLTNDKIEILGSHKSYCKDLSEKYNFFVVIKKLKTCLHVWKSRVLTLAGKILFLKPWLYPRFFTLLLRKFFPNLTYELDLIQKEFILYHKRPKIKHSTLTADYSKQGYKSVDLKSKLISLKLISIKKVLEDNFHTWKRLAKILPILLGDAFLFHSNLRLYRPLSSCI